MFPLFKLPLHRQHVIEEWRSVDLLQIVSPEH
jgi:hypothetical protein